MATEPIRQRQRAGVTPHLASYDQAIRGFSWEGARRQLDGLPGGRGLNIAHEAVDRHASGPLAAVTALRCVARDGGVTDLSYADLKAATSRFANLLGMLGAGKGDRVFSLLGRVPELYVAALGTLKNTSVFSPLFPAFGPVVVSLPRRRPGVKMAVVPPVTPGVDWCG